MAEEVIEQNYDWLIIFLVYNNDCYDLKKQDTKDYYTMEEQTSYILSQIRYTRFNKKVKTIFVEAEIKNTNPDGSTRTNPVATVSMLYKKRGTWLSSVDGIWREGESIGLMTSTESLTLILNRLKNRYNAKKHMIVTAGHGAVLGINAYLADLKQKTSRDDSIEAILKKETTSPLKDKNQKTFNLDPSFDIKKFLFLTNKEINDSIKNVFGEKKIDLLVMYNCIMQNIFTQFELRETVDWLVAPLSGISIPGFNYESILNEININPDISGELISELFVNSIRAGNGYTTSLREDIEHTWKFSATKLDQDILNKLQADFESVFEKIETLAVKEKAIISTINEVIKHLFSYSVYCLRPIQIFDLGSFAASVSDKIINIERYQALKTAIDKLQDTLQSNMVNNILFIGKNFYNSEHEIPHYDTKPVNHDKIMNVGILFPINRPNPKDKVFTDVYDEKNYLPDVQDINNRPPTFLMSTSYAKVVNRIHKLIPMGL